MALFNKETPEERTAKIMAQYGLENISADYAPYVKDIAADLAGNKLIEVGTLLQGNGVDSAKMSYLSAIMKQNWIIIKLLDEIAKK